MVASYEDLGRSGVRIANRPALIRLLGDVTAKPGFSVILVYDVSRWGRFQDTDASAYYDYHCRLNGVSVVYVAETFRAGVSPMDALVKSIKRVMAAEYSRDLSLKCAAGQRRVLAMGFQMGVMPCLGYRRESVSADGQRRVGLEPGQRKFAATDRIRWVLAPDEEVALVRHIFDLYAHTRCSMRDLVRMAHTESWVNYRKVPMTLAMIAALLRCEAVIGNFLWGRPQNRIGHAIAKMSLSRLEGTVPRIVDDSTWALVQAKLRSAGWTTQRSSEDMLTDLKLALDQNPGMTSRDLAAAGCATKPTYASRFGSWEAALKATGTAPAQVLQNARDRALDRRVATRSYGCVLAAALFRLRVPARFDGRYNVLTAGQCRIRVRLQWPNVDTGGRRLWHFNGYESLPEFRHVLFVRVDASGVPIDFFLGRSAQIALGFPPSIPREVPADLHEFWIQSRDLMLKRVAGLCREEGGAAAKEEQFSAAALKWHRHVLGLSAKQCGALIGVAGQTIGLWEGGNSWPSPRHKEAIASFQDLDKRAARVRLAELMR